MSEKRETSIEFRRK